MIKPQYSAEKKAFSLVFVLLLISTLAAASNRISPDGENQSQDIVIGKTTRMYSDILKEWRPLEVYLPDNYMSSDEPYPVMLVLDGGGTFRYCVSLLDMMSPNHFPSMIVIGLPNTDRRRDLDPIEPDSAREKNSAYKFLLFLKDELFPYLEKEYRARDYRVLAGHSLAGIYTVYAFLRDSDIFDAYIATSPGFHSLRHRKFLENLLIAAPESSFSGKSFYFSAGSEESPALHEGIRHFDKLLKKRNNSEFRWSFDIFEEEGHVPVKGFYQGLRNIFYEWIPAFEFFVEGNLEDVKVHYGKLTNRFGYRVLPPTDIINALGGRYLREDQSQRAVEVYKYFVSLYPKSSTGYFALGNSYFQSGQIDLAVLYLRKSLEFDPENTQAKKLLTEIKTKK